MIRIVSPLTASTLVVLLLACSGLHANDPATPAQPTRFDLGRPATHADIARLDIDVRPDGTGLPDGGGTADEGRALYEAKCRHCHGEDGRGTPFDRLTGRVEGDAFPFGEDPRAPRSIGSYWPYATTVFDYTRRAMPLERPGSLSDDEVYALTAYLLHLNDLWPAEARLDRDALPKIEMPARDRFVPDDRRGGKEIR
ncbi:MAG: cytochrome c [bacterium]|nr:cytochrome c [bacterium]